MKTQTVVTKTIIPIQSLICRLIQRNKSQLIWRFRDEKLLWQAHQNYDYCAHYNIQVLLIKQNATWKACAWNGQKTTKAKTRKTTKKHKNDNTSVSSKDNDTNTSRVVAKTTKMLPWKSNNILPQLNVILLERRMMKAAMMNQHCWNQPANNTRMYQCKC